jgi:DNA-binding NarL/FixJ family response regulator
MSKSGRATPRSLHVLVVERDPMARLGPQQMLSTGTDLQVMASVSTIQDAEHVRASTPADVVLVGEDVLDVDGIDGIDRMMTRFARAGGDPGCR